MKKKDLLERIKELEEEVGDMEEELADLRSALQRQAARLQAIENCLATCEATAARAEHYQICEEIPF
jgi:regulator of replication initiation timing